MTQPPSAFEPCTHDHRLRRFRGARILGALSLLATLLFACGQQSTPRQGDASPYPGWHAIPPPTSDPLVTYAMDGDATGLILACAGTHLDQPGQAQFGPAHLWRTRDYGAHWQQLDVPIPLRAGCGAMFIRGSKDAVSLFDDQSNTILVSPDAGDTWKPVTRLFPNEIAPNRATSMASAVYRDGRLYASLIFWTARVGRRFAVSDDYGLTWTLVDEIPPAGSDEIPIQTYVFAPDYRAPKAWFRYTLHAKTNISLPHYTTLDRSTDDGRTWSTVSTVNAPGTEPPESGSPLVTTPGQPARLCTGLFNWTSVPGYRRPFQDLVMGGSSDGGATWRYVQVTHISPDNLHEGTTDVWMDARGACYTEIYLSPYAPSDAHASDASILKWPADPDAQPQVIARPSLPGARVFGVSPSADGSKLRVVATISDGPTSAPRLFWTYIAV